MDRRDAEVRGRLDRYLAVVEAWGLCPWAAPVRRDGSLRVEIVRATGDAVAAAVSSIALGWATEAGFRIGLIVVPDAGLDPAATRRLRDHVAAACPATAIANFHPDGGDPARALDAARLVSILRRSPDPMLQIVPHAALAAVAVPVPVAAAAVQVAMLAGAAVEPVADPRARIAADNLDTVRARGFDRLLAELAALRRS